VVLCFGGKSTKFFSFLPSVDYVKTCLDFITTFSTMFLYLYTCANILSLLLYIMLKRIKHISCNYTYSSIYWIHFSYIGIPSLCLVHFLSLCAVHFFLDSKNIIFINQCMKDPHSFIKFQFRLFS
jgi:hypothetical protein